MTCPSLSLPPARAFTNRLMPLEGGLRAFNNDLHPLNAELELDPFVDSCEVDGHPMLIAHAGDATATSNGGAGAGGHVIATEVFDLGQVVDVAGRLCSADAHITD